VLNLRNTLRTSRRSTSLRCWFFLISGVGPQVANAGAKEAQGASVIIIRRGRPKPEASFLAELFVLPFIALF